MTAWLRYDPCNKYSNIAARRWMRDRQFRQAWHKSQGFAGTLIDRKFDPTAMIPFLFWRQA
jgi:hypothetical protein